MFLFPSIYKTYVWAGSSNFKDRLSAEWLLVPGMLVWIICRNIWLYGVPTYRRIFSNIQ